MIEAILRFSIRQRLLIFVLGVVLILAGIYNALHLPIDAVPDITNKQVQINAVMSGLAPEEMERQVTFPLELALSGMPHLQEMRSISQFGLSQVTVVFEDPVEIYFARQLVNERLQEAREQLPEGVKVEIGPVSTGLGEIYYVLLEGEDTDLLQKHTVMDWSVRPALRTVPGLAEINTWGGLERQYQVLIDPQRLLTYHLTMRDVINALASNNQNVGGAYLLRGAEQQLVRSVGVIQRKEDLERIVIGSHEGVPITVGMVAQVTEGGAVRQGAITSDGRGEEVLAITMLLMGENGRVVVQRVKEKVRQIEKSLPPGTRLVGFLDRAELIHRTLKTALTNLTEGGLLVIVVLFLFLLQMRAGLIVSSVIPLSMLFAVIGMRAFGVSANLMSLGAIDFGLIVDGAVIIVENAVRRLAEARKHSGRDLNEAERLQTIEEASAEVLKPSIFGVGIILAAYLPILSLSGIEGKMFRPMGLTVVFALAGALLLSFTLVPALCGQFLRVRHEHYHKGVEVAERWYRRALLWAMRHRWQTTGAALVLLTGCLLLFPRLGSEFIPELDEGAVSIFVAYPPGMSLEAAVERATALEQYLKHHFPNEVKRIITRIGRAELATDPMLPSQHDVTIELEPREQWQRARTREQLVAQMAEELEHMPGIAPVFSQPIKLRMMELIEGVGIRSDVGIKLFGSDPEVLSRLGKRMVQIINRVPGAADVNVETTQGLPQLQIKINRERIARYGINVADVNEVIESAVGSKVVTQVVDGAQQIEVAVRLQEQYRNDPQKIGRILIPTPDGVQVPLSELAEIKSVEGPVQISRENGQRRVVIQANVRGRDLGSFVEEVKQRLDKELRLPTGYYLEYGGTYEHLQSGRMRLAIAVPLTFGVIFLLLLLSFGRFREAAIVFTGVPFAVTGGILALWLRGMPFSMSAGIGFIALGGIAVLNGVVMVTFINQLRARGLPVREAVIEGALGRLRPVLMTASVASFGFIPMAISTSAGAEVQRPLATVVIGGLITATILTLLLLPMLVEWVERKR